MQHHGREENDGWAEGDRGQASEQQGGRGRSVEQHHLCVRRAKLGVVIV